MSERPGLVAPRLRKAVPSVSRGPYDLMMTYPRMQLRESLPFQVSGDPISIGWEGLPNWIAAGATFLTFVVAIIAAFFAYRASRAAGSQAEAGRRQADAVEAQLAIAAEQASVLRQQLSDQAERELIARRQGIESRIDAIAPTVLVDAKILPLRRRVDSSQMWQTVSENLTLEPGDGPQLFEFNVEIRLRNVSGFVARVAVPDASKGEFAEIRSGQELVLAPGETAVLAWRRRVNTTNLQTDEDLGREHNWLARPVFWVRDLGINVRDTLQLTLDLRYFERDGSRLLVTAEPRMPSALEAAEPAEPRQYERLDAGVQMASPIGAIDPLS